MLRFSVLFLALILAACDGRMGGGDADAVKLVFIADEGLGDPALASPETFTTGAQHLGLTALAADGRVIPALATSWRALDDGRSYVFKLREAYWSDGRRLTSGDVVTVLRRQVSPGSDAPLKPYLLDIEGAIAVAANRAPPRMLGVGDPLPDVVTIELSQPDPNLLAKLAHPSVAIVRREDTPPPSGAYRAEMFDGAVSGLTPNSAWFGIGDDRVLSVDILPEAAPEDAIAAYRRGEADIVAGGTTEGLRTARQDDLVPALRFEPTVGVYGYVVNVEADALADVRVRRALSMAIDRTALVQQALALTGMQAAYGPLPPTLPPAYAGAVPDWAVWEPAARLAEAQRLLGEAGYGPANPLQLDVAIPRGPTHEFILAEIADDLAPLGVALRAYKRSAEQHRDILAADDYDLALVERISPIPMPRYFLAPFSCEVRTGGFCDPDADALLRQADLAEDGAARIDLTRRAARLLADDAPFLPLFSPVRWALVRPGITGWEDNIAGAHPPHVWRRGG